MFKKLMQKVDRFLGRGVIDDQLYEELEEALLQSDTHIQVIEKILQELRKTVRNEKITDPLQMKERLKKEIALSFSEIKNSQLKKSEKNPTLYLFVGVNGVGKTTTIAKLASRLNKQGQKVLLAAGDTYRAAAIEQLEIWGNRLGVDVVRSQHGADAAATVFDAIQAAKARGCDYILADTAGRQHNKTDLMNELSKVERVAEKGLGRKPDEILLVLDANTGQNALRQAEEFSKATQVSGLILTKLDGTSRGGALIGVYERFKIPIKLIGIGEKLDDLKDFNAEDFSKNLFE